MGASQPAPMPPGRQPWDPLNGLRVGTLTGAFLGAALLAVTGLRSLWVVVLFAATGGAIGFWSQKRLIGQPVDSTRISGWVRWSLVVVFVGVGFSSVAAPRALSADAPSSSFSASRAMEHVEAIAAEPHPMGSLAIADVREYLSAQLREAGLEPAMQTTSGPSYFEPGVDVDVVNVYATIEGTDSTGTIVLVAHYDSAPATPGANDNSTAVAALLETGRVLLAGSQLRNDVLLLFTDGEEPAPRYGSPAFVDEHPVPALVVNFEAAGASGPSQLVEVSGDETVMIAHFAAAVSDPVAFSFVSETTALLGEIGTDFDPFRNAGVPGFHFAYMRDSPKYHTMADNLDSVSLDSLQHHGSNAVGLTRRFGNLDLAALPNGSDSQPGEGVYFTLRPFFVQYGSWVSVVGVALATVLLGLSVGRLPRDTKPSVAMMASGAARAVLTIMAVTALLTLAWIGITSIRSSPSVTESYVYLAFLVGGSVASTAWLNRSRSRTHNKPSVGFALTWVGLGLVTSLTVPGFSYLFVWPALAAAIAANWRVTQPGGAAIARFALVAGPTIVLLAPAVEFYFQFGQPRPGNPDSSFPVAAAVAFLLATLAAGLIHETRSCRLDALP